MTVTAAIGAITPNPVISIGNGGSAAGAMNFTAGVAIGLAPIGAMTGGTATATTTGMAGNGKHRV
ncbi:MAG: hypothetical protein A2286_13795 [Gammaproteobacteria bacterium RIFOXYA12_FULL_61_12]|nr:MAG: hypothetical protein A2514_00100 [Gammaproteobacteria bacterium RIFOXYD12_FULL_61_37]OGT90858.1 MAG: hypothetical protein A2286_13795 [Gammaproteobacteria bacterium RIFOXYA12_FULL_61_12]